MHVLNVVGDRCKSENNFLFLLISICNVIVWYMHNLLTFCASPSCLVILSDDHCRHPFRSYYHALEILIPVWRRVFISWLLCAACSLHMCLVSTHHELSQTCICHLHASFLSCVYPHVYADCSVGLPLPVHLSHAYVWVLALYSSEHAHCCSVLTHGACM